MKNGHGQGKKVMILMGDDDDSIDVKQIEKVRTEGWREG